MDVALVRRLIADRFRRAETYWIALIVGSLINAYGQLLVPWIRGADNPFTALSEELRAHPALTLFTILLAYVFPVVVGITSAVLTRYRNRRVESIADFPDRKPDPVFRATRNGEIVEIGSVTRELFVRHEIDRAQDVLGEAAWSEIVASGGPGGGRVVFFDRAHQHYVVSHAPTANGLINVYMTPMPESQ